MSSALALQSFGFDEFEPAVSVPLKGVQALLQPPRSKPPYLVQGAAVAIYILALTGVAFYSAKPAPPVEEDAVELVMLSPPAPEEPVIPPEEPMPPVAEATPQSPEPEMAPPPPVAEEPAVAPVEPPKPKPVPQPKPKVAEHKPVPVQHAAPSTAQAPAVVPPNAIASGYANQVHARIAAAAAAVVPRAALAAHQSGRVGYRIVISPSGAVVSQNITPSGNPAFDTAATQALARASFPATGMTRNASLSGAIVFQ